MTSMASVQKEYQHLLQNLKLTVDGLLIRQVSNVWSIYGGLNRVHNAMEKILKHGCRVFTPQVIYLHLNYFFRFNFCVFSILVETSWQSARSHCA